MPLTSSSTNPLSSSSRHLSLPSPARRRRSAAYKTTPNRITCSSSSMDPITSLGRLLWGRSLPPSFLISTARAAWHATWHLFMRQLAPTSSTAGSYSRPASQFPTVSDAYLSAPRRRSSLSKLRLYAAHACPWAHRTLIVLALKNAPIQVSMAAPGLDGAWELDGGAGSLKQVYQTRSGGYDGRVTVPMLWDEERKEVVCNESYGIIEFFNSVSRFGDDGAAMDLAPEELRGEIQRWNGIIYPNVNNGVYRCGFAQSQEAYDAAVNDLFSTLDMLESHLATSRYLCGDALTLADVCLFTTLIRFDLVYNVLFKCTKKKLVEYPNLHAYARDIYQIPKVAETCNVDAIMDGYYRVLFPLNPGSIRPVVPSVCEHEYLLQPHNRESVFSDSQLHAVRSL